MLQAQVRGVMTQHQVPARKLWRGFSCQSYNWKANSNVGLQKDSKFMMVPWGRGAPLRWSDHRWKKASQADLSTLRSILIHQGVARGKRPRRRRGRKPHLECLRECGLKPGEKKAKERWDGRVKWLKSLLCLKGQIFSIVAQEVQGEERWRDISVQLEK